MITDFFRPVPKKRSVKIRGKGGVIYKSVNGYRRWFFYVFSWSFVLVLGYIVYLYFPIGYAYYRFFLSEASSLSSEEVTTVEHSIDLPESVGEFSVTIPRILAYSIIEPQINPFNPAEYDPVLEKDVVAQAKGSNFPGTGNGSMNYIFAHSTRQGLGIARHNSVFYLLGELREDDVIFVRYGGKVFSYSVYLKKVVTPKEIEYLTYKEPDKEILIMQTCWPIGTDWNRLLVFAKRV